MRVRTLIFLANLLLVASCQQPAVNNYYTYTTQAETTTATDTSADTSDTSSATTTTASEPHVVTDYEKYALYVVNAKGYIEFEDHCEDWAAGDVYATIDAYFYQRKIAFEYECYNAPASTAPWHVLYGQLYEEPGA